MKLAVIGSRVGADLEQAERFVSSLPLDITIISGGAEGIDELAEQTHLARGGAVVSLRAKRFPDHQGEPCYGVERWDLDPIRGSRVCDLLDGPIFADYVSALFYRDALIAQECDRLVAFVKKGGSRGSLTTHEWAQKEGRPVFLYEAA